MEQAMTLKKNIIWEKLYVLTIVMEKEKYKKIIKYYIVVHIQNPEYIF